MHHIPQGLSKNVMLTSKGIYILWKALFVIFVFPRDTCWVPTYLPTYLPTYSPGRYYEKFENYPPGFRVYISCPPLGPP
jgi:hypothetical protein